MKAREASDPTRVACELRCTRGIRGAQSGDATLFLGFGCSGFPDRGAAQGGRLPHSRCPLRGAPVPSCSIGVPDSGSRREGLGKSRRATDSKGEPDAKSPARILTPHPRRQPALGAEREGIARRRACAVMWRGRVRLGAWLFTRGRKAKGPGGAGSLAGVACARGRATPPGPRPRGLTVNESEGPQENDPGQPEGARAEAGLAARGVAPLPRRRPRLPASARSFPPPESFPGRRHCRAFRVHARGGASCAGLPRPQPRPRLLRLVSPPTTGRTCPSAVARARPEHARAPRRRCGAL